MFIFGLPTTTQKHGNMYSILILTFLVLFDLYNNTNNEDQNIQKLWTIVLDILFFLTYFLVFVF